MSAPALPAPSFELNPDSPFRVRPDLKPAGDQPVALAELARQLDAGAGHVVLRGATGTGKSATAAWLIANTGKPALVIAPNKILAAQLVAELRDLLPGAAVELLVSHFDYYQPEAYVAARDLYIEKDSSTNAEVERARHAATAAVLTRKDVVIVATVSCIYGLGDPRVYLSSVIKLAVGGEITPEQLSRDLVAARYTRNDVELAPATFRLKGDTLEVFPAGVEHLVRIEFFGDEIETISLRDRVTGASLGSPSAVLIPPASHHVADEERVPAAIKAIEAELESRCAEYIKQGRDLEAQRLRMRTENDLEMIREAGFCSGIENYSRHFDGRAPGTAPFFMLDYFREGPVGDFLTIIDESHVTVPQLGGMYEGDASRKRQLVEFGFRLPSALDNRPLRFDEALDKFYQVVHLSATPGKWEMAKIDELGLLPVEQVIRPTGLVDPSVEVRPSENQIDDLLEEIRLRVERSERVLVTTLTKKMAEQLSEYMAENGVKVRYLHSDVGTIERIELLRDLRLGVFDVLVGINLLREGLDLPEVSLVAILDADMEGFLRSPTALIQTIGRAARNPRGAVILYADRVSAAMETAMNETERRRNIQIAHNKANGITPVALSKAISTVLSGLRDEEESAAPDSATSKGRARKAAAERASSGAALITELELEASGLRSRMEEASGKLLFEEAAGLRDMLHTVEIEIRELRASVR